MNSSPQKLSDATSAVEFDLTDANFARVATLVHAVTGIQLPDHKRTLAKSRLSKLVSKLEVSSFDEYLDVLEAGRSSRDVTEFCNALTTNLTSFFREPHHFEHLDRELSEAKNLKSLRIWSAGCSTGEETYSIAMTALNNDVAKACGDKRILATDLDTAVLDHAKAGIYTSQKFKGYRHKTYLSFLRKEKTVVLKLKKLVED